MIGKILIRSTFSAITYCLSPKNGKERAEVLHYNQCFGTKAEVKKQFEEVADTNKRLQKPSMHIILSMAPTDRVNIETFREMSQLLALEFGFEQNQYIVIHHSDTKSHDHIHICINRQSITNSKTLSDSKGYKRIAQFCRKMEQKFQLTKVKSPNCFLPPEERIERNDKRRINLKEQIKQALQNSQTLKQFQVSLFSNGVKYEIGRGIKFSDDKITVKGSDLGYSLEKVKSTLISNILKQFPIEQRTKQLNIEL